MGERTCDLPDCPDPHYAFGLCRTHAQRWRKRGSTDDPRKSLAQRFWEKVNKDGPTPAHRPELGPCWVWTASLTDKGYGQLMRKVDGRFRPVAAHRVSWELHHGSPPPGLWVLHHCDNRLCVRADGHLFLGTPAQNTADMMRKGRDFRGDGPRGDTHYCAKLTADDVAEIRRRYAAGELQTHLAQEFGVRQPTVSAIVLRQTWKHVA